MEAKTIIRFLRPYSVRIVAGVFLVAILYGVAVVWMTYERELRIARELESLQGSVYFHQVGPTWMPKSVQERLPFLGRIGGVFLRSSDQVTDADLLRLQPLTTLMQLDLDNTSVTDTGMAHLGDLKSLEELSLYNTRVSDAGLEQVQHLTRLWGLYLGSDDFNDEDEESIQGRGITPRSKSRISDHGLRYLKGLDKLCYLTLRNTQVTDQGLQHLKHLTGLQDLSLDGARITDEGLKSLAGMVELMELNLSNTAVTNEGLEQIKLLGSLVTLNLEQTRTTQAGREKLRQALPNCTIRPDP